VFSSEYSASDGLLSPDRPVSALSRGLSGTSNPGTTYSATDLSASGLVPLTWHVNQNVTFGLTSSNQIPAGFNPLAYIPTGLSTSQKNAIIAASNSLLGATSPVLYGNSAGFPYPRYTTLYRPSEKYDFSGSGEYKLIGDNVKLFADAYYVNYRSSFQLAPSPLSPLLQIPSANYWFQQVFPAYVSPTNGLTQSYRAVELGPRVYTDQFEDFRFVGGLRGKIADSSWNWEAGYLFAKNTDLQQASGGLVRSDLDALLQSDQPGAWNPFGYTPLFGSSAVNGNTVQAFAGSAYLQYIFKVQGLDFRFGGNVVELPAGPLAVSFGAQSRRESFDQSPDLATKNALISPFNAIPPLSAMRNVYSGYGEAVVPIFGKDLHIPLVSEFSVSGAARYEDYSDVGDTGVKPRVSGRWKVLEQEEWTFRGSWAQGFSAPSFSSLYSAPSQNFYEVYNPYSGIREQPITGAFEEGNRNLKPTKSETWLVGTSWSPKVIKGFTIGMDYYSIEQNGIPFKSADYIVSQWFNAGGNSNPANPWGPNAAPGGANPAGTQIDYNDATGQFQEIRHLAYINAGKRETDGIDLNLSQEFDFDFGKFTLSGMATHMLSFKQQDLPGGPTIDYLGRYWDNSAALADTSYPDWRANITLSYQYKRITAAVGFNYTSGYTENYNGQDLTVSDYPTLDLRIGYRIPVIEADLLVGVNNVTDELPRVVLSSFENNSDRAIADPRGRMFFASLSKEF
jgi:iron complex outermembrane receptor protein